MSMEIPSPPTDPDLNALHRYVLTLTTWLKNLHVTGTQLTPATQAELDGFVSSNDLTQSGKGFYNSDTGHVCFAEVTTPSSDPTLTIVVI